MYSSTLVNIQQKSIRASKPSTMYMTMLNADFTIAPIKDSKIISSDNQPKTYISVFNAFICFKPLYLLHLFIFLQLVRPAR